MSKHFDVIVIGAGVNGLSTGWHLAHKEKRNVLLLEQFPFPHNRGSSHGHSRITRKAYAEVHFCKMMKEAYSLWNEIEKLTHEKLFIKCGLLSFGVDNIADDCEHALKLNGFKYASLNYNEVKEKYPQFKSFKDFQKFNLDYEAGVLLADKCLKSLQHLFISHGGTFHENERVTSILPDTSNQKEITIRTSRGQYTASSLVITAGSWAVKLLRDLGLNVPVEPRKVCLTYWKLRDQTSTEFWPENCPTFFCKTNEGSYYSSPELEYPGCVKIAYHDGVPVDPDSRDSTTYDDSLLNQTKRFIANYFPQLDPEPAIADTCLYTMSPDRSYILDRHPNHPNIVFGTGFSGSGFKTGPVVGKILSLLALNKTIMDYDLSHYRLDRFKINTAKL